MSKKNKRFNSHRESLSPPENYYSQFEDFLKKCFGENELAIITFVSKYRTDQWDVNFKDGKFRFGINDLHDLLFKARLIDFYSELTGATIRVFTNQVVKEIPVKKLFGVALLPNFTLKEFTAKELLKCHTIDTKTGKPMPVEENVIFCDTTGEMIGWFDVKS